MAVAAASSAHWFDRIVEVLFTFLSRWIEIDFKRPERSIIYIAYISVVSLLSKLLVVLTDPILQLLLLLRVLSLLGLLTFLSLDPLFQILKEVVDLGLPRVVLLFDYSLVFANHYILAKGTKYLDFAPFLSLASRPLLDLHQETLLHFYFFKLAVSLRILYGEAPTAEYLSLPMEDFLAE